MENLIGLATLLLGIAFYFLPIIIAYRRDHINYIAIFIVNLLLGWTVIGWIAALIWAVSVNARQTTLADRR